MNSKPMIYLAHPMRGKKGDTKESNVDYANQNKNSCTAINNVRWLRDHYPQVDWYCPGEVEPPVQTAHQLGYLSINQILEIDFTIIRDRCLGLLAHRWESSVGVDKEVENCKDFQYPYSIFEESPFIWECNQSQIQELVDVVLRFQASKVKQ